MRIVALRALGLGDLMTAIPALRALRAAHPRSRLVVACPRALHELIHEWGLADETIEAEPLETLPRAAEGADLGVNLHGRGPESTRMLLASRPGRLVAFCHPDVPETREMPTWVDGEPEVGRWCRLLAESGMPASPRALDVHAPRVAWTQAYGGCTLLHPGAAAPARRWPWERWAALALSEQSAGRRVLLTGSVSERPLAHEIAQAAGLSTADVLAGRTSQRELAALVGVARVVVSGDTGVAHVATAVGTPSVILFGPVSPAEWGPPAGRTRHRVLWAGQTGDPHAGTPDPGLLRITVEDVQAELQELDARAAA